MIRNFPITPVDRVASTGDALYIGAASPDVAFWHIPSLLQSRQGM
jgi:hypothetical protein